MDYSIINTSDNLITFVIVFYCTIFPAIPFIVVDIYYGLFYQLKMTCLESTYFTHITMRIWLLVNGSISAFSLLFTLFIFMIIYTNYFKSISACFQNTYFIKGYIILKLTFNIVWTIIGTLMFIDIYDRCLSNLKIYICIRISTMFVFILLSIRKIKRYLFDIDSDNLGSREVTNI